ncbi:hypothetical protein [Bacillus marinisedimentorum]|uniref:hypothetical protein n=1 Tax=Bacillus marinisedimentorum TaxID=1821260 RepID=UPI0007DEFCB8|nr:hypothetical protein [Bacillus marinisedimentorum]
MKRLLKWSLFITGLGVITGALLFAVSFERSVPKGVDLGIEPFYFLAFLAGGFMVFLSTRFSQMKKSEKAGCNEQ